MIQRVSIYLFCFLIGIPQVWATNRFADPWPASHADETWSGSNGAAYSSTANGAPAAGYGYQTVQAAVNAMSSGDDIYLRDGEYDNAEIGNGSVNTIYLSGGAAGTSEDYSSIQSFPGEWAILDGENSCAGNGSGRSLGVLAPSSDGYDTSSRYWRIERLEFKNGATSGGGEAAGLSVSYGPAIIRYCYIHDNNGTGGNNPAGICGYQMGDSVIEYNYFYNNGGEDSSHNCCHIQFFSGYAEPRNSIAIYGFAAYASQYHVQRNIVRYNYFVDGVVGIKTKGNQLFTGRSQDSGESGYSDTYNDRGNNYHHNIFQGMAIVGISSKADFNQIHNNIIDGCGGGIRAGYEGMMYKNVVYNNTIIDPASNADSAASLQAAAHENNDYSITNPETSMYNYFYNNIIDAGIDISYRNEFSFGVANYEAISGLSLSTIDIQALYSYRPDGGDTDIINFYSYGGPYFNYTASEWMASYTSHTVYLGTYNAGDLLYQGTTGADKYRIRSAHVVDTGVTAGAGGRGGSHPYLSVTIPSYFGAANPSDDGWIAQVLAFTSTIFTGKTVQGDSAYDESWIEGAESSNQIQISPGGFSINGGMGINN